MIVHKQNNLQLIREDEAFVIYELPSIEVNLVTKEQLEELKKPDELFFKCTNYSVQPHAISFTYEKISGYHKIDQFKNSQKEQLKEAAIQLLETERLIGTPYTTIIHPNNIFINNHGDVKYAHRGIRNVFPNQTLSTAKIVTELRKLFIYLFSDIPFEMIEENTYKLHADDAFLISLRQAKTTLELKEILTNHSFTEVKSKKKKASKKEKKKSDQKQVKESSSQKLSPLMAILIGLMIGMALIYFMQVIPLNNASSDAIAATEQDAENELAILSEEKALLEETLAKQETRVNAYQFIHQEDNESAIQTFESLDELTEVEQSLLYDLYVKSNTIENLTKALALGPKYEVATIRSLASMNTSEANEVILSWESIVTEVQIEQAYLNKEYKQVIAFANELEDDNHAKRLAAYSHLALDQHEEALALGKQIDNVDIQIKSLEKEIAKLEADKNLDEEELAESVETINKQIEELRDKD